MEKRNTLLLTVIAVATLLVAVVGATFAYFASATDTANTLAMNVTTMANNSSFTATATTLAVSVTADEMLQSGGDNTTDEGKTSSGDLIVDFASAANGTEMFCTYDIVFTWGSEDKYQAHSAKNTESLKEFTIQATPAHTGDGSAKNSNGTNLIEVEKDFVEVVGNADSKELITDATIYSTSTTASRTTWTFTAKFYNLATDQSDLAGMNYVGNFAVTGVQC